MKYILLSQKIIYVLKFNFKTHDYKFFIFILLLSHISFSQNFSGNWSGIIYSNTQNIDNSDAIYLQIEENGNKVSGLTRIELFENATEFAVKSFKGEKDKNTLIFSEDLIRRSSKTRKSPECKLDFTLQYDTSLAYLTGDYISSNCRSNAGKVILFRSEHNVTTEKINETTHIWRQYFIRNYKKNYPAPEILKQEQKNFKFQTIHFDYDKAEIKPEYFDYLQRMARVLDGIHDLRVKITGHTDADGTDNYNMSLSEQRADAIREYFKKSGIDPEKLEIDFKGKRQPVDNSNTKEGNRKNRRVVFEFI